MLQEPSRLIPSRFAATRILASGWIHEGDLQPSKLLGEAIRMWKDTYDGDVVSLPLPPEVPGEVPLVILSSQDDSQHLEIARKRVNVVWQRSSASEPDIQQLFEEFSDRIASLCSLSGVVVSRLGAVIARVTPVTQPGMVLAQQFCRDNWLLGPLNRPEGFELHAHKVYALLQDLRVNSWMRIKTTKAGDSKYGHVLVEQDINTLEEEAAKRRFTQDEVRQFFGRTPEEFSSILSQYFPSY